MSDPRVVDAQTWANNKYGGRPGYVPITVDGQTGWQTMYSLTRALQIELGITTPVNDFGPTTLAQLTFQVGNVTAATWTTKPGIFSILQAALWCKGYWGGSFGTYDANVGSGITTMKAAIGLSTTISVEPKVFKSLLTMDAYTVVNSGTAAVRAVQQWLNGTYLDRRDFFVIPCDGLYSRNVQEGLVYAIQYEIGMADGTANGNFGPGTQQGIRDYGNVSLGSVDGARRMVRLFQAALTFNRQASDFTGTFTATTKAATQNFQTFSQLTINGTANFHTWASLLVSTGDPSRSADASDASTPVTAARAAQLYASGYRTIGRYLSVAGKRYQGGELATIFAAGLTTFPIFQEANNAAQHFTNINGDDKGYKSGYAAALRAQQLGFKQGATIYFPVDYDPVSEEIDSLIKPYFSRVAAGLGTSISVPYRIGVYGTRNVCERIVQAGLAAEAFIAGLSTGWSGNLGFPLPAGWSYDQIQTLTIGSGSGQIEIDKNVRSPSATNVGPSGVLTTPSYTTQNPEVGDLFWRLVQQFHAAQTALGALAGPARVSFVNDIVLQWTHEALYWDAQWQSYVPMQEVLLMPATSVLRAQIQVARSDFKSLVGSRVTSDQFASYAGDIEHWAATVRGYTTWGIPSGDLGLTTVSDLGGWALDLTTLWADYVAGRQSGEISIAAKVWLRNSMQTAATTTRFNSADVIADVDGYLTAKRMKADDDRPMSDIMREILVSVQANGDWRYQAFYSERFGSTRSNIERAVVDLFTSTNPLISGPRNLKLNNARLPGVAVAGGPSSSELDIEMTAVKEAFADVITRVNTP